MQKNALSVLPGKRVRRGRSRPATQEPLYRVAVVPVLLELPVREHRPDSEGGDEHAHRTAGARWAEWNSQDRNETVLKIV